MHTLTNIDVADKSIDPLSYYDYDDEIRYKYETKHDGVPYFCSSYGYNIKSGYDFVIPAEEYDFWKKQIVNFINEHNNNLLYSNEDKEELKYVMIDVDDDNAYTFEKYVHNNLCATGKGWYKNLKFGFEKKAWRKAVKEYKKAKGKKLTTDIIDDKENEVREYIKKLDAYLEEPGDMLPPIIPSAIAKLTDDPCEFISDIIQKGCQGVTGLSLKELINYYVKIMKHNIKVAVTNFVKAQSTIVLAVVEPVFTKIDETKEYFEELDTRKEEFLKEHSDTLELYKDLNYEKNNGEESNENSSFTYTPGEKSPDTIITGANELWNIIKNDLGMTPTKKECLSSMKSFKVKTRDANGVMKMKLVNMHKSSEATVKAIFDEIYETTDFKILQLGSYDYKNFNGKLGNHSWGSAIDLNCSWNPCVGKTNAKLTCKNTDNDIEIRSDNHPVVKIFKKYGWGWGGLNGNTPDYMHFSCKSIERNGKYIGV